MECKHKEEEEEEDDGYMEKPSVPRCDDCSGGDVDAVVRVVVDLVVTACFHRYTSLALGNAILCLREEESPGERNMIGVLRLLVSTEAHVVANVLSKAVVIKVEVVEEDEYCNCVLLLLVVVV